jgi:hypothetical protein
MTDYSQRSFWLETCGDDLTLRPALTCSIDLDDAILGGGYTGLWTAYYLLCTNPDLRVAILEREIVGHAGRVSSDRSSRQRGQPDAADTPLLKYIGRH